MSNPQTREAVAVLYRVIRSEPRLRLGAVEALELAPLVAAWLARVGERDLADALLPGLPPRVYNPLKLLRIRLTRKMPPISGACSDQGAASGTRLGDCPSCRDPLGPSGVCLPCAGLGDRSKVRVGSGEAASAAGAAKVRAAWRAAQSASRPLALA
ncbi:hypothetical protein [Streptacidiphilus jiangxiensis]|uniref:hypothetical protein n=1 Tax=Streptacidiphilus jiangxiensis TaxID=235985 RepID=UPI001F1C054F|nr:hypothetical protein [Streptacidiphilus jiangxiensis]